MAATFTKPDAITIPFASAGDVTPLPTNSSTAASQQQGWPPIQSQSLSSGGLPVNREQSNGVVNLYSQFSLWNNVGGQWTFDADVATAGGYNAGAVLYDFVSKSYQVSLVDNNIANFVLTRTLLNDRVNWLQITNPVSALFNGILNDIPGAALTVSEDNGFQLIANYDGAVSYILTCPNPSTGFSFGFSFAVIFNEGGTLHLVDASDAFVDIVMPASNDVHLIYTDLSHWWVDGQEMKYQAPVRSITPISPIIQIGTFTYTGYPTTVTFDIPFPNSCTLVHWMPQDIADIDNDVAHTYYASNLTTTGFVAGGNFEPTLICGYVAYGT